MSLLFSLTQALFINFSVLLIFRTVPMTQVLFLTGKVAACWCQNRMMKHLYGYLCLTGFVFFVVDSQKTFEIFFKYA